MTLLCLDVPVNTARLYTLCPALDCPEEQVKRTHESLAYHPPLGTLMLSPGPPHLWGFPQVWGPGSFPLPRLIFLLKHITPCPLQSERQPNLEPQTESTQENVSPAVPAGAWSAEELGKPRPDVVCGGQVPEAGFLLFLSGNSKTASEPSREGVSVETALLGPRGHTSAFSSSTTTGQAATFSFLSHPPTHLHSLLGT
jgi:hypothetical protein